MQKFEIKDVHEYDVRHAILSLPTTTSPGSDEVGSYLLKLSIRFILPHITHIINTSIRQSRFPARWKQALVCPIPKTVNVEDPTQQRPISLLSLPSKVCERVILDQFLFFLHSHNLYPDHQFGGRKGFSAETLAVHTTDKIRFAMANGKITAVAFIDLSKAFDSIDHSLLLEMLVAFQVGSKSIEWFKSYLTDREIITRVGNSLSQPRQLTYGVPQGSVLSPLLFNLYTSDMINAVESCELTTFIDDTKISKSFLIKDFRLGLYQLQKDLSNVFSWCSWRSMQMNPAKTQFMVFGTKKMLEKLPIGLQISFCGQQFTAAKSVKYVGVTLDENLTMTLHVDQQVKSASFAIKRISQIRHLISEKTAKQLIMSLAFPKIFYGSQCVAALGEMARLQKVQNYAARVVKQNYTRDHISPTIKELGWLRVKDWISARSLQLLYDSLKSVNRFKLTGVTFCRNQRDVVIQLDWSTHEVRARACKKWNSLPREIKQIDGRSTFKGKLQRFLLNGTI
jgi:hypothetical protein